jgi:hypothetical protein
MNARAAYQPLGELLNEMLPEIADIGCHCAYSYSIYSYSPARL